MSGWGDLFKNFKQVRDKNTGEMIMVSKDAPEYELDDQGNIVGGPRTDKQGTGEKPKTGFSFGAPSSCIAPATGFTFGVATPPTAPAGPTTSNGFVFGNAAPSGGGSGGACCTSGNCVCGMATKRGAQEDTGLFRKRQAKEPTGTEAGHVYVAGNGDCGQMGLGEDGARECPVPTRIPFDAVGVVAVTCGGMHTLALTVGGQLWSWGCNDDRALGRNGDENVPAPVGGLLATEHVIAMCAGDCHSAALTKDGRIFSWGTYKDSNGIIGYAPQGQEGVTRHAAEPELVPGLDGVRITSIASGTDHTLAVEKGGTHVYTWGCGEQQQLGRHVRKDERYTNLVPPAAEARTLRVLNANFLMHVEALVRTDPDGDWSDTAKEYEAHRAALLPGRDDRERRAGPLSVGRPVDSVYAGSYHSLVLTSDGSVLAFGLNNMGQLGLGPGGPASTAEPMRIPGEHHTVAVTRGGEVHVFGRGDQHQLGLDDGMDMHNTPQRVSSLAGKGVIRVYCGSFQTAAVTNSGELYTWGFGDSYQLCNGVAQDAPTPTLASAGRLGQSRVLDVGMGGQHTVVLLEAPQVS